MNILMTESFKLLQKNLMLTLTLVVPIIEITVILKVLINTLESCIMTSSMKSVAFYKHKNNIMELLKNIMNFKPNTETIAYSYVRKICFKEQLRL